MEMDKEKMLVKSEEKNVLRKIIGFIKNIFFKKQKIKVPNNPSCKSKESFAHKMKEDRKLLDLQKSLESGKIKEEELTEEQKEKLLNLYNNQIRDLQQNIKSYERILNSYKEKILEIKRKLNN